MWADGSYVRLKRHSEIPETEWGAHGVIVRAARGNYGRSESVVIVRWDEPSVIGSFVYIDYIEPSDAHTLYLGVLSALSKARENDRS